MSETPTGEADTSEKAGPSERLRQAGVVAVAVLAALAMAGGRQVEVALVVAAGGLAAHLARRDRAPLTRSVLWLAVAGLVFARAYRLAPEHKGLPVLVPGLQGALCVLALLPVLSLALRGHWVALALFAVLGLETGLGFAQTREPVVTRSAHPLVGIAFGRSLPWAGGKVDFRELEVSGKPTPGVFRILLLGASSVYGHAQPTRANTLVERLEHHVSELLGDGKRAEAICLSAPGLTSFQELALLVAHGLALEPALVVCVDGYNDMMFLSPEGRVPGDVWFLPQQRLFHERPLLVSFAESSALFRKLAKRQAIMPWPLFYDRALSPPENDRWAEDYARNLDAMTVLCRDRGVPFVWSTVPLVYDREPRADGEMGPSDPLYPEFARRTARARELATKAVLARGGVVVDVPALIGAAMKADAGKTKWFVDDCHYSDEGNDVLGRLYAEELKARGLLGGKP